MYKIIPSYLIIVQRAIYRSIKSFLRPPRLAPLFKRSILSTVKVSLSYFPIITEHVTAETHLNHFETRT